MADAGSSSSSAVPLEASLADNWCRTKFKFEKCSYVWIIEDFSECEMEVGEPLDSSTFSSRSNDVQQLEWSVELYPNGVRDEEKDYVSVYIRLAENNKVNVKLTFAILNADGERTHAQSATHQFGQGNGRWGFKQFIRRDFLLNKQNALLPNGQLSIFCEITVIVETINATGCKILGSVPQSRLVGDMGEMLAKSLLSDCVVCSDGQEFKVHKNVLACRSPVFAAMFDHDTEEKRTNKVNIPDISAPVLGQLLHFLYTGCEPPLLAEQDMAEGLLAAADKYQLGRLKALCEQQLSYGLNKDNVCTVLALADRYSAEHLKACAMEYINMHGDEVMESDGWNRMVSSHPELLKLGAGFTQSRVRRKGLTTAMVTIGLNRGSQCVGMVENTSTSCIENELLKLGGKK